MLDSGVLLKSLSHNAKQEAPWSTKEGGVTGSWQNNVVGGKALCSSPESFILNFKLSQIKAVNPDYSPQTDGK